MERAPTARAWAVSARALGLLMLWFGAMRAFEFEIAALGKTLAGAGLSALATQAAWLSPALGALECAIGAVLLAAPSGRWRRGAAFAAMAFWAAGLLGLLSPAAWVHDAPYGGFPVIGSGQTLLKHLGIAGLALGVFAHERGCGRGRRRALWTLWAGQWLVLGWIGAMKFTRVEAEGVAGLMQSSPLFSWLYGPLDVQGASNLIGAIELLTAALIATWPRCPRVARWGLLAAIATYLLTNSFLLSLPGWQPGYGFPFVGGTGQFLLKDVLLLLGAWALLRAGAADRRTGSARAASAA
ncbi:DUF417 family protein [Lysobacter sp. K5869]|uniref:DUF417 family protein n=1 Tax=Lysobacter sp. K5869 TaxID=2820808 RepID=UPI001C0631C8|nr:DUF417 family protein [Lysobacter sp. K5869]QWP78297.1 DUF417 family protein [Lysobacter sp. K5869]